VDLELLNVTAELDESLLEVIRKVWDPHEISPGMPPMPLSR
jgi:hypothetical protein